ncbi:uncharacterized protein LOC130625130 [Hydractinia symbiolongicarpus]|uniref:uncharacterized protein LOC130625130 n=1 Tax=Hydractinia symbiolongicarpus TaxID=13093 RepID=UPI00254C6AE9|nr:uncharacterized protein LOC130625130 [Hydractinia symbiolongicarpus]
MTQITGKPKFCFINTGSSFQDVNYCISGLKCFRWPSHMRCKKNAGNRREEQTTPKKSFNSNNQIFTKQLSLYIDLNAESNSPFTSTVVTRPYSAYELRSKQFAKRYSSKTIKHSIYKKEKTCDLLSAHSANNVEKKEKINRSTLTCSEESKQEGDTKVRKVNSQAKKSYPKPAYCKGRKQEGELNEQKNIIKNVQKPLSNSKSITKEPSVPILTSYKSIYHHYKHLLGEFMTAKEIERLDHDKGEYERDIKSRVNKYNANRAESAVLNGTHSHHLTHGCYLESNLVKMESTDSLAVLPMRLGLRTFSDVLQSLPKPFEYRKEGTIEESPSKKKLETKKKAHFRRFYAPAIPAKVKILQPMPAVEFWSRDTLHITKPQGEWKKVRYIERIFCERVFLKHSKKASSRFERRMFWMTLHCVFFILYVKCYLRGVKMLKTLRVFWFCLSHFVAFDTLSSLYRGFIGLGDGKFDSLNRGFVISVVRYIEGIYKSFLRQNPRGTNFGSLNRGVRYVGGSLYRESTVIIIS